MALICPFGQTFLSNIYECVPNEITGNSVFLQTYNLINKCAGGLINSLVALEGLRFCQSPMNPILIAVNDVSADYSALYDIRSVPGTVDLFMYCLN